MTQLSFQSLRKASMWKRLPHYSFLKLHIPTPSGKAKSIPGESEMKERDCPGPRGSAWRNKSCSCLKTAVALRLLYSTHYYQDILTFSIKGKGGGTDRLTSKGVWLVCSFPWSCCYSLGMTCFKTASLAGQQPPPREPRPSHECILSRQPATKTKEWN